MKSVRARLATFLLSCLVGFGSSFSASAEEAQPGWGQNAFRKVDPPGVWKAAQIALIDWQTLIPASGALVFAFDHLDRKLSNWADRHHPVFGSQNTARDFSNYLLYALNAEVLLTALATSSGEDSDHRLSNKAKGIRVELIALGATGGATLLLKSSTGRQRPNDDGNDSFPSGHSSGAFAASTLSNRNLDAVPETSSIKLPLQIANIVLATTVGWSRIEGQKHFPSDVLAGAAIGHFTSVFIHDALMGVSEIPQPFVAVNPSKTLIWI
jgi:membrane-associated phospholipid phosphatase